MGVLQHLYYVARILCKVDYNNDKFIHAPTYSDNGVMWLLEPHMSLRLGHGT